MINTVDKNGKSNIVDSQFISPLTQQLFASLLRLINNTVSFDGKKIWSLDDSIFMIPFNNNIIPPSKNLYMLIHQQDIRSLMHQQQYITDYKEQTIKAVGEFTVDVQIDVYSPTTKPYGMGLQEQWSMVFNQSIITKWIYPFGLLNTGQRFKSIKPISLELDNGEYVIKNIFQFTLMYSLENIAKYVPYDTIDTDLNQINRDV